jgi:hypothetical protein
MNSEASEVVKNATPDWGVQHRNKRTRKTETSLRIQTGRACLLPNIGAKHFPVTYGIREVPGLNTGLQILMACRLATTRKSVFDFRQLTLFSHHDVPASLPFSCGYYNPLPKG